MYAGSRTGRPGLRYEGQQDALCVVTIRGTRTHRGRHMVTTGIAQTVRTGRTMTGTAHHDLPRHVVGPQTDEGKPTKLDGRQTQDTGRDLQALPQDPKLEKLIDQKDEPARAGVAPMKSSPASVAAAIRTGFMAIDPFAVIVCKA